MWSCKLSSNPSIAKHCSVYVSLYNPRTVSYRSRLHWRSAEWRRRRSLRWRRRRRRREEERKGRQQDRPYFCAVLPKVCETRNPRPQRSGIPHASPSPIQGSGLFCNNVWVFDWIHSGLKLFFSWKFEELKFGFVFCFLGGVGSLYLFFIVLLS